MYIDINLRYVELIIRKKLNIFILLYMYSRFFGILLFYVSVYKILGRNGC